MAVDTRNLNLVLPQIISNRDLYGNEGINVYGAYNDGQMGCVRVPLGMAIPDGMLPLHQSLVQPKTSMNTDSGLTCNISASRKRSRDYCFTTNFVSPQKNNTLSQFSPAFVGDDVLPQLQQYQFDVDTIISQHEKKIRVEIEERQKQQERLIVQTLGERLMKKLIEKDEQIQRIGKLNLILQERVKSLYVEKELWRDLAQSNEATANSLRTNLEQVLAHVGDERFSTTGVVEEDVQSCCGSSDDGRDGEGEEEEVKERPTLVEEEAKDKTNTRMCKCCEKRESCVLLLPCRHLCLCTVCGSTLLQACPVCNSSMNASVHVNMSSS